MKSKLMIFLAIIGIASVSWTIRAANTTPLPDSDSVRSEIEALLDSKEFQEMFPGVGDDREAFIQQAMSEYRKIENMPDDERNKLAQEAQQAFEQIQQQAPSTMPKPAPVQPRPEPVKPIKENVKKTTETVSESRLGKTKELLNDAITLIERIFVDFSNQLRVSSDNVREHTWVQKKPELTYMLAYLKAIAGNDELVQTLASHEFSTLHEHLHALSDELRGHVERLASADSAELRDLSDSDAARAQAPVSKTEKKRAKHARNAIIDILSGAATDIKFGAKTLLEKYAPKTLKETDKKVASMPMRSAPLTKSGGGYGPSYGGGRDYPSSYYPSSYYPSGSTAGNNYASNAGVKPGESSSGSLYGAPGKEKTDKSGASSAEKAGKKKDGSDDAEKTKKGAKSPQEKFAKLVDDIKKSITELDDKIKEEFFDGAPATQRLSTLAGLDRITEAEPLEELQQSVRQVDMKLLQGMPYIDRFANEIENLAEESQDAAKRPIVEHLNSKKFIAQFKERVYTALRNVPDNEARAAVKTALAKFKTDFDDVLKRLTKINVEARVRDIAPQIDALADLIRPLVHERANQNLFATLAAAPAAGAPAQAPAAPAIDEARAQGIMVLLTQATARCAQLAQTIAHELEHLPAATHMKLRDGFAHAIAGKPDLAALAQTAQEIHNVATVPGVGDNLKTALLNYLNAYNTIAGDDAGADARAA